MGQIATLGAKADKREEIARHKGEAGLSWEKGELIVNRTKGRIFGNRFK